MKSVTTNDPEFNEWWKQAQLRDEYRGVPMAAAYGIWLKGKGKAGGLIEEPEAPSLPKAFLDYWETASQLSEFRGQTKAGHYATWLAAQKALGQAQERAAIVPDRKAIEIETPRRKRAKVEIAQLEETTGVATDGEE